MNKKEIIEAIFYTELYTSSEARVLTELIKISIDLIAVGNVKHLIKITKFSSTAIYASLKSLLIRNLIVKSSDSKNSYRLNQEKLDYIVQLSHKKKTLENM